MKQNEGTLDRIVRAIVGLFLFYAAYVTTGWVSIVLLIVGLALLITALMGYCHLYTLLKVNTLKKKKS